MGGNAFDLAQRISAKDYADFCDDLQWSLRNVLIQDREFVIPKSVREKDSHGDVDILVIGSRLAAARELLEKHYTILDEIKNPSGFNLLFSWNQYRIQVDLNKVADDDFHFAKEYFSWNDCGNLIGRIAHRQGLKFGHDGMWYIVRDGDNQLGELLITSDYYDALAYLGFDVGQYLRGFNTFEQMFNWVKDSQYFEACAFPLEHRNHAARTRDKKRKTYTNFLKWLSFDGEYIESDKATWLEKHKKHWAGLGKSIDELYQENELNKKYKAKVNGLIVRDLTGLDGKELGKLMNIVRRVLPREVALKYEPPTIESGIMFAFQIYKDENEKHQPISS